jgi:hypothetical protein
MIRIVSGQEFGQMSGTESTSPITQVAALPRSDAAEYAKSERPVWLGQCTEPIARLPEA